MADLIQIRRDTRANWASANPKLAIGEVGIITDNNTPGNTGSISFKVGDGTHSFNQMPEQTLVRPETVANLSASNAATDTRLTEVSGSLSGSIAAVDQRLTNVSGSLSGSIAAVDQRLTNVSGSIDSRINEVSGSLHTEVNLVSGSLESLEDNIGHYTCKDQGITVAKTVSAPNYTRITGGAFKVKFNYKHTATSGTVTLKVGNAAAADLYYDGAPVTNLNTWEAGETVDVYFDGQYYMANNVSGGGTFATRQKVKNVGIDDEPTAGSNNLVKSGGVYNAVTALRNALLEGDVIPAMAETLAPWADQKAIATPDTYTDAVRTTGGDIPIETSAGSKLESIKPVAGSKWTTKLLFNGSYNMLNAAKWGAANSQPYVGGVGSDFVYFLVPELTLGTFGTADENNGLLFTDSDNKNVQPSSVYYKPLGATVPQSLTDGTSVSPTSVSYDGNVYKTYETSGAGWLIIPKSYYDNDVCAHIAWEDWYDKHVSLDEPTTNPEAVVGILMLEGLLDLAHSDKYLRGVNDNVCDNVVFGDTSATISHMVDELSVAANAWTNAATGESDSQGNALYRHSATISLIKQGGAACVKGEDGGIPLTVNGTTVSYIDTNATAPASTVFYEVTATSTTKAYTDSIFSGSNINTETGVLPINDCSIEAQVAVDGTANITVKYAKNIVDQVAINATVDVPQIKKQVEEHKERIEELEDTAVRTNSYDASVSVGLADNLRGDTIVNAEFYKRKTGGTQSVGSGIAAIKEMRGKSIVWNQLANMSKVINGTINGVTLTKNADGSITISANSATTGNTNFLYMQSSASGWSYPAHKYYVTCKGNMGVLFFIYKNNENGVAQLSYNQAQIISNLNDTDHITGFGFRMWNYPAKTINCVPVLIDLTLMFGAGNEPATVAEFEKMFPLDYYDYNEGEVIPFAGQNLVTTGKNQYNPATGKANLLGGQTYQIGGTYTSADIAGVAVTLDSNNCFTTTKDCVLDITGGNDTDTIVALYNGENVTFEPYEKHTLPLDPSQWRDKQGNLVFPYGGMHGIGSVCDYAKVDADGYIRKAVRRYGQVNLGSLNWVKIAAGTEHKRFYSNNIIDIWSNTPYVVSDKYRRRIPVNGTINNAMSVDTKTIIVVDYAYDNASESEFKTAMQGVMLIYLLETPVEVELATPVYAKYLVDKDGTEEITPANGTTPYTTMANLSILYAMDARGEIKNLPKNYLSKESAENMLNAMVTAGVIASYTMTWDAANSRYVFTFVAPTPE